MSRQTRHVGVHRLATRLLVVITLAAFLPIGPGARSEALYTRAESDAMQRKIEGIVAHSAAPSKSRTTTISQREVNSYLRFHMREQVPQGITEPVITIVGDGRVSGEAIVDLDAVSRSRRSSSMLDPMRWLTGRLPVTATGRLETGEGEGRFVFGSATVGGVPVPRSVLQQVLTHYSRTPENPNGLGLEDRFTLPAQIREIRVQPGEALVVQ
jgi:hypothetical protein